MRWSGQATVLGRPTYLDNSRSWAYYKVWIMVVRICLLSAFISVFLSPSLGADPIYTEMLSERADSNNGQITLF